MRKNVSFDINEQQKASLVCFSRDGGHRAASADALQVRNTKFSRPDCAEVMRGGGN